MDILVIILTLLVGYMVFLVGESCLPRKTLMRRRRDRNERRGITMRPGWMYKMPNGETHMSPTGREKDMIISRWRD